ncbi:MAG: hypothetical protein JWQ68_496 [Cryobacterium sp.]|jgi:low temperature requirement protein LtrA|nr:hypothetical protein [Cryobacterium sp.]
MPSLGFSNDLLRPETGRQAHRVTFVELFFDLVFVFAVTQVSHVLLEHRGPVDLVHTIMLTAVVWWVWINTTWVVNWLNPVRGWVRGMLIGLMFLAMLMSSAIPQSFTDKAALFAITLAAMQVGRSVFTVLAFAQRLPEHALNFVRISIWHALAGGLWIWGAFGPEEMRLWLWLIALAIESAGARARFWVPGLGRSAVSTWDVSGDHMAERVSLFFIIALGESIVVTGSSFSSVPLDLPHLLAFLSAFTGTVLLWLLYFNHGARGGREFISNAEETGTVARAAYTYTPLVMVLGIVLAAVADGLVLKDPDAAPDAWTAGLICGSFIVYLIGSLIFRRETGGPWLASHLVGALVLAGLFFTYPLLSPLALAWIANVVLFVAVVADELAFRRAGVPPED